MIDSGHPCWRSFNDNKNEDKNSACQSLGPLSSLEPDFNFDYHWLLTLCYQNGQHYSRRNPLFSNVLLLHKLLITGKGNLVVDRKAELDRDLLNKTCRYKNSYGITFSKVSCRHKSAPGVQSAQKSLEMMDFFLSFGSLYVPILQFCLILIKRPLTPPLRENKMLFSGNMTSQVQDVHVF